MIQSKIDSIHSVISESYSHRDLHISSSSVISDFVPFVYVDEQGKTQVIPIKTREKETTSQTTSKETRKDKTTETTQVSEETEEENSDQSTTETLYTEEVEETPKDPFKLRYVFYILLLIFLVWLAYFIRKRLHF